MKSHSSSTDSEAKEKLEMRPDAACLVRGSIKDDPEDAISWRDISCVGKSQTGEAIRDKVVS